MTNQWPHNPLGLFNYTYMNQTPGELALTLHSQEFTHIHLDPRVPAMRPIDGAMTEQWAREIRQHFEGQRVKIVALAGYTNLVDPIEERREEGLRGLESLIEICQAYGTSYIATQSGSFNKLDPWGDYPKNHTPAAWDLFVQVMDRILGKARAHGVTILIEGYVNNVVATTEECVRLVKDLGRDGLGFIMDPFNYFTRRDMENQREALQRIFDDIADLSPVAHAKDVIYTDKGIDTPKVGSGRMDWPLLAEYFSRYMPETPLILEHLGAEEVDNCTNVVKQAFLKNKK